ncbi:MAG TPA: hypothetical protein VJ565_05490, partial [Dehalococcoidia bacterium]|nr:hypothetical protein [Dehalococcoidia bacterium]
LCPYPPGLEWVLSLLAWAVKQKRWEVAALCLLLGVVEVLEHLPPEALEGLLEVLDGKRGG